MLLALLCLAPPAVCEPPGQAIREDAYEKLDRIRATKKVQLTEYLDRIQAQARSVRQDDFLKQFFAIKSRFYQLQQQRTAPPANQASIDKLKRAVRQHYLRRYLTFYDILCADRNGNVFYTIRRQADYHKNLFEGELGKTSLAHRLRKNPEEAFVDFEFYAVSDEPSAFFVEPAVVKGEHLGWFVLQCSINKINDIFTRSRGLGKTGEVFLVNEDHQMLTDSRFRADSSILKQHLSAENIREKFAEGQGRKIVTDYRGYRVLTSFEVCRVMGRRWLLIAKIDESELLTDYYRDHRDKLRGNLLKRLAATAPALSDAPRPICKPVVIDIDEFRKAQPSQCLATFGVSTCTGVLVTLPKKFAYGGHLSSYDCVYGEGNLDLLGHMIQRIKRFDIYPYQQRRLEVVLVAPHLESIARAVDKFVDEGFVLSQLRFCHHPGATSASVWHDVKKHRTVVEWVLQNGKTARQLAEPTPSVGGLFRKEIGYE